MNIKIENWNGHEIRFVEKEPSDWWAVGSDVATALEYRNTREALKYHCKWVAKCYIGVQTGTKANGDPAMQRVKVNIIPEKDVYRLIFRSDMPEAEDFQDWVFDILQALRQKSGHESYQVFDFVADGEHHRKVMDYIHNGMFEPTKEDYIKSHTIANKAVSNLYGYPKMLKKAEMTPDMLQARQSILEDTAALMVANEKFDLGLSVSTMVYAKYKVGLS